MERNVVMAMARAAVVPSIPVSQAILSQATPFDVDAPPTMVNFRTALKLTHRGTTAARTRTARAIMVRRDLHVVAVQDRGRQIVRTDAKLQASICMERVSILNQPTRESAATAITTQKTISGFALASLLHARRSRPMAHILARITA